MINYQMSDDAPPSTNNNLRKDCLRAINRVRGHPPPIPQSLFLSVCSKHTPVEFCFKTDRFQPPFGQVHEQGTGEVIDPAGEYACMSCDPARPEPCPIGCQEYIDLMYEA